MVEEEVQNWYMHYCMWLSVCIVWMVLSMREYACVVYLCICWYVCVCVCVFVCVCALTPVTVVKDCSVSCRALVYVM